MNTPLALLRDIFGYPAFRGAQAEIIDHICQGGDALVLMPTGGVNVDNVGEWLHAGCVAVGAGGALTGGGKTLAEITATAKKFIQAVKDARK